MAYCVAVVKCAHTGTRGIFTGKLVDPARLTPESGRNDGRKWNCLEHLVSISSTCLILSKAPYSADLNTIKAQKNSFMGEGLGHKHNCSP